MVAKYGIKYFYDITDRSDFRANPDYKGVCHIAMAQEGHCLPGRTTAATALPACLHQWRLHVLVSLLCSLPQTLHQSSTLVWQHFRPAHHKLTPK